MSKTDFVWLFFLFVFLFFFWVRLLCESVCEFMFIHSQKVLLHCMSGSFPLTPPSQTVSHRAATVAAAVSCSVALQTEVAAWGEGTAIYSPPEPTSTHEPLLYNPFYKQYVNDAAFFKTLQSTFFPLSVPSPKSVREGYVEDSGCWSWYSGIWLFTMHLFIKALVSLWIAWWMID